MKKRNVLMFVVLVILLLSIIACSNKSDDSSELDDKQDNSNVYFDTKDDSIIESDKPVEPIKPIDFQPDMLDLPPLENVPEYELNIIIKENFIFPKNLSIPLNQDSEILIQNEESSVQRFEATVHGLEIKLDLKPRSYQVIIVHPKTNDIVELKLNRLSVGALNIIE